jgi:hypothetical protein
MLDTAEIDRNYQRRAARGMVAVVAEADPDRAGAFIYHKGFGLSTNGPVSLAYEPTSKVAVYVPGYRMRRQDVRAAYSTSGQVRIAETPEEALSLLGEASIAEVNVETDKDARRPSSKKPTVKKSEEDQQ